MSLFNYKEDRFTPHPVRFMDDHGVYLSDPVHLYTEKQKKELEDQGADTSNFTEITAKDIMGVTALTETDLETMLSDIEMRIRTGVSTTEDTESLASVLRAGIDKFWFTATESDSWYRAAGAADVYNAMSMRHQARVRGATEGSAA